MTGYESKKAAAQDKMKCQCSMTTSLVGSGCQYCNPEYMDDDALTIAYQSGYYDGKKAAAIAKTIDEVNWADHEPNGLAQPAQEPAAWRTFDGEGGYDYRAYDMNEHYAEEWNKRNSNHKGWVEALYTTTPQRPWVGLTLDEIVQIGVATGLERAAVDMISNKLKEKNT